MEKSLITGIKERDRGRTDEIIDEFKKDALKLQRVKANTLKAYLDFQPIINAYCYRILGIGGKDV